MSGSMNRMWMAMVLAASGSALAAAPKNCEARAAEGAKRCENGCKKAMSNPAMASQKNAVSPKDCAALCAKASTPKDCEKHDKERHHGK